MLIYGLWDISGTVKMFSIKEARKPREATNNLKVQPTDSITDVELKAKLKQSCKKRFK